MISFNDIQTGAKIVIPNSLDITLAWCPAGDCILGSSQSDKYRRSNESPQVRVSFLRGFWISSTPITMRQYRVVVGDLSYFMGRNDQLPAEGISWSAAKKFCSLLYKQLIETRFISEGVVVDLPTEAQWEYACRANTNSTWHFGDDVNNLADYAWFKDNSGNTLHPVGEKLPNQWGIYDMYGNVPEWTLDNFHLYKLLPPNKRFHNPVYQKDNIETMVVRGGGYHSTANFCRSSTRSVMEKSNPYNDEVGFRIVINSNNERTNYANDMDSSN